MVPSVSSGGLYKCHTSEVVRERYAYFKGFKVRCPLDQSTPPAIASRQPRQIIQVSGERIPIAGLTL